jgi:hypothetical protein
MQAAEPRGRMAPADGEESRAIRKCSYGLTLSEAWQRGNGIDRFGTHLM